MSQVLQPKSVNKRYRGTTRLAVYIGLFKKPPIKILQIFDACLNVLARNLNFGSDKLFFFSESWTENVSERFDRRFCAYDMICDVSAS